MIKECVAIGVIQGFLDGELTPRETAAVSAHTAVCERCAGLLANAEEENAVAFAALDRELDVLVPSQRLWRSITDSIEHERTRTSLWQRIYSFAVVRVATPMAAAAGGVLIVLGVGLAIITSPNGFETFDPVSPVPRASVAITQPKVVSENEVNNAGPSDLSSDERRAAQPEYVQVSHHSSDVLKRIVRTAKASRRDGSQRAEYLNIEYIPGEESYIKTIGELERNAGSQTVSLRASDQVAYQRDLAIVEDSIKKMQRVVRKSPRNQAARQVLYASYQDKIDLLNSAVQRDELIASLQ